MSALCLESLIYDFCSQFKISIDKLTFIYDGRACVLITPVPVLKLRGSSSTVKGLRGITSLVEPTLTCPVEIAILDQWIEYASMPALHSDQPTGSNLFKELNDFLSNRVYLAGNKVTAADYMIYLCIYKVMVTLSFHQKELLNHICRWFSNVQQETTAANGRVAVMFSRTPLFTSLI